MIGRVLDNRYELVEFVGKGGMALVYRAVDQRTGHSVAVKILRPEFNQDAEFLGRFEREATTASKMSHHNIVNLLDVGQDGDIRYLVMEYVNGQTLKDVIRQKGALPPNVAAQIGIRILSALQHAHNNGIIHRDIKPQNILMDAEGHIKVSDFGIARVAGANTISTDDSVMGSVHYFSPEQAKNENVTFASDLYSVGVCLYEMMTGQPPFDGETPVAVALQHINAQPKPMSEFNPAIPPAIERVVMKAMEKRPEMRYQNALEMAQDLQRALQEPDGTWMSRLPDKPSNPTFVKTGNTTSRQKPVRSKRRMRAILMMGIIGALIMAGLIGAGMLVYDSMVNKVNVPDCMDETEQNAVKRLERAGLVAEISRRSDPNAPLGTVFLQAPEVGTSVRKGDTVLLAISTGPQEKTVPNLIGMTAEEAKDALSKMDLAMMILPNRKLSDLEWDTVLEQIPPEGEKLQENDIVQVTLSGGCVKLPNLIGMTLEEAKQKIAQMNLDFVKASRLPIDDVSQFDRVITQLFYDDTTQYEPETLAMLHTKVELGYYVSIESMEAELKEQEEKEAEAAESPAPAATEETAP